MSRIIYQCPQCGEEWSKPHCAKCADEREAHSLHRMVRRWQWSWHRCKPFRVSIAWWGDRRITVQKGVHVWLGWWRLSGIYLEQEAPNAESSHAGPVTPGLG